MIAVLDASALLAFLQDESGATEVEALLDDYSTACSAANWSEVAQKTHSRGADWGNVCALLLSYGVVVEPVTQADAEWAARRWRVGEGLSLADRLCLATGYRLKATVVTADKAWSDEDVPVQIIR